MTGMAPSDNALEALGRAVIADGRLRQLQVRLSFSANAMGELLGVSPITYNSWMTNPATNIWPSKARQVGERYTRALEELHELRVDRISLDGMVPFHQAAMELGWPQDTLLARYRDGQVDGVEVGILGMWMPVNELNRLRTGGGRRVAA